MPRHCFVCGQSTHAETLNMELLKRYNEAGIEFAFPTQTLYVNNLPDNPSV